MAQHIITCLFRRLPLSRSDLLLRRNMTRLLTAETSNMRIARCEYYPRAQAQDSPCARNFPKAIDSIGWCIIMPGAYGIWDGCFVSRDYRGRIRLSSANYSIKAIAF